MSASELSTYTAVSKYATWLPDKKRRETWPESVARVEGMMLGRFPHLAPEIREAYGFVRDMKVLGSQRAMQFGGPPMLRKNERGYNCTGSYCDRLRFFQEAFYLLLCGCGTGFSVQEHHVRQLPRFSARRRAGVRLPRKIFIIPDCIEGWADAAGTLLSSYFDDPVFPAYHDSDVDFDPSFVRLEGSPLSFGIGKAPGPEPLMLALRLVREKLDLALTQGAEGFDALLAYDVLMLLSDAVLAGGVRRSASICVFSHWDEKMLRAKTGDWFSTNPQRARSNNSAALLRDGTAYKDYRRLFDFTREFGEPGGYWTDDYDIIPNPCNEIGFYPRLRLGLGEDFDRELLRGYRGPVHRSEVKGFEGAAELSGWQMCVAGWTYLVTRTGVERIGEAVGREVEVWNGLRWSRTTPFVTGRDRKLLHVTFSDGSFLDCTENHNFIVSVDGGDFRECEAKDLLTIGRRVTLPRADVEFRGRGGRVEPSAYEYGFFFGSKSFLGLKCRPSSGRRVATGASSEHATFPGLDRGLCAELKGGGGLPAELFSWDVDSILCFFAGWADADGMQANRGCRVYGTEHRVRDGQLLLTKAGVNSSVNLMARRGERTNFGVRTQDVWYLQVPNASTIPSRRLRLAGRREPFGKGRVQVVRSVEPLPGLHTSYCLTETERHVCLFNNVLTKQCNLTTVNGKTVESEADFYERCEAASTIGTLQAAFTDFPYLGRASEEITRREALLGVSVGGIMHHPELLLRPDVQREGARRVGARNGELSPRVGVRPAARWTAIKPDGNSSRLMQARPGIHAAPGRRYFMVVQANRREAPYRYFRSVNPEACELSVYEKTGRDDCVRFCVEEDEDTVLVKDLTAVEQLENVRTTYLNWIVPGTAPDRCTHPKLSNNVSNTVTVRPHEWDGAAEHVYRHRHCYAGVAFAPESCDRDYAQAPYTSVYTREEQEENYGAAAVGMAAGLVEECLAVGFRDLWEAAEHALSLRDSTSLSPRRLGWLVSLRLFADNLLGGDVRRATYCLKDHWNWELFCKLKASYRPVDYTLMVENDNGTMLQGEVACTGGACLL